MKGSTHGMDTTVFHNGRFRDRLSGGSGWFSSDILCPDGAEERGRRERLMTPVEMAKELQISKRTLLKHVNERGLPCKRLNGRVIRFLLSDVLKWMGNNK